MRLGTTLLAGILFLAVPQVCSAQAASTAPEFVPDRPDFTESSEVVGRHVVQVETGLRLEQSDDTTRQVSAPQMLVRVGLGSRVEVRIGGDGYIAQSMRTPGGQLHTSGHSDAQVSTKVKLLAGGAGLHLAVLPFLSLPTASHGFGSTGYDPGVKLAWARDVSGGVNLSGNVNASSVTADVGRRWKRELSLSAGHGLGGAWGAYWEAFGSLDAGRCDCSLDTGVSLAIGANSQIDIEAGRGISGHSPHWFVGGGFAVRRRSGTSR